MSNRNRLAAVGSGDGLISYRVYYQDQAGLIKESCFDEDKGWYVRENCIVAKDAKKTSSPLAAVSWAGGNEIRVYYMNSKNMILERKWSVESSDELGVWQSGTVVKYEKPDPLTHFAVARTEESDGSSKLRLFYQSPNRELRQTSRDVEQTDWSDTVVESDLGKVKFVLGGSIGIWVGWSIRIFCQSSPRDLVRLKEENGRWTSKKTH